MKLKYYLRGLGTGILFATLILFISYTYHNTDAQIKKRAKELGMVETTTGSSVLETEKTSGDAQKGTSSKDEDNVQKSTGEKDTVKENTTEEQSMANEEETTTGSTETTNINENVRIQYEFSIVSGMTSQQVAGILQNIGAVDSAAEFDKYLIQNGYADRIRVGNFKISEGASYSDIANLITN